MCAGLSWREPAIDLMFILIEFDHQDVTDYSRSCDFLLYRRHNFFRPKGTKEAFGFGYIMESISFRQRSGIPVSLGFILVNTLYSGGAELRLCR